MKIQREGLGLRQQDRRELLHPRPQQLLLLLALGAIGVVGGERFFGEHIQTREQPQSLIDVVVVDMAQAFLAE